MEIPPKYQKYIKISAIVLGIIVALACVAGAVVYVKREAILDKVLAKAKDKALRDYQLNLAIQNAHFEGLSTLAFSDISVVPENRDSLLHIHNLHVKVKVLPLLLGDIKLAGVSLESGTINLIKRDSVRNYDFLFKKKKADPEKKGKANYAELANHLLIQILYKIPEDMDLKNFSVQYTSDTSSVRFHIPQATIQSGDLRSVIWVNNKESIWHIDGTVEPSDQKLDFKLYAEGKKFELSYLEKRYGIKMNFDTVYTQLKETRKSGGEFHIIGSWAIRNLLINHPKIAAKDIIVPFGSIDADIITGPNYIGLDSSSVVHLKNIAARPYVKVTLGKNKIYELKLRTDDLDAQNVFNAFPQGLFENLEGIKVTGKIRYSMDFALDSRIPDSVNFSSSLTPTNFKVIKWGATDLTKFNQVFVYTPYEYGKPMRDITVGPSNPNYTPIDEISPVLRNAVMTEEDPSFFSHHGFVEKSIRGAIATNFKAKKFKRGASTISMQLVKNVFLNRQKNLGRKIEEMLMVWIIENGNLSNKRRMYEVYLNIIEWGRNVYGIGEAARYYFDKTPANLDLGESLFLANIVPRPKAGLSFFEPDGSLRTVLRGYFKIVGNMMAARGYTQRDTNAYGFYGVRLKESLRRQIAPADTMLTDSLFNDLEDPDFHVNIMHQLAPTHKPDSARQTEQAKVKPSQEDTTLSGSDRRKLRREQRRKEREMERAKNE